MSDPVVEDIDLDYHDEEPDPNADAKLIENRHTMRSVSPYHEDLTVMWDTVRALRKSKKSIDPGGASHVVWSSQEYAADVPRNAASLYTKLQNDDAWRVRMLATKVRFDDLVYVGNGDDHDAGDVRTPAHVRKYLFIQGVRIDGETRTAWFKAAWEQRDGAGPKFDYAHAWDIDNGTQLLKATAFNKWIASL